MRIAARLAVAATWLAGLAACGMTLVALASCGAWASPVTVKIAQGVLRGDSASGVASFKAIPYAAPPVGDLRWRPPAPAARWTGVRPALAFGPACMQPARPSFDMSEDCLTLNISTPATAPGRARLPVMVWIHGGAFVWGSGGSASYDGSNFTRRGVVVVTINYRLGRFGFFAHPALTAQDPGAPLGDYGFLDQIAALKWVAANIAAFGGDPRRVTIAGESAGAMSVNYLMVSPLARGLFQGAISESGFGRTRGRPIRGGPLSAEAIGLGLARRLGIVGEGPAAAAALRALPAPALNHAPANLLDRAMPGPIIDGVVVPEDVVAAFAAHREAKVPYLVGGNSWEASLLPSLTAAADKTLARLGADKARAVALFGGPSDLARAAADVVTDEAVIEPDRYLAARLTADGAPAFVYFFGYLPAADRGKVPGVPHGGEIGYVFGNLPDKPGVWDGLAFPAATAADRRFSGEVNAYWAAFLETGNPDSAGGPAWPAWSPAAQSVMVFGEDGPAPAVHFEQRRLDFLSRFGGRTGDEVEQPTP